RSPRTASTPARYRRFRTAWAPPRMGTARLRNQGAPRASKTHMEPVVLDVFSDVVCPWCYLGVKRLLRVVADEPPGSVQVRLPSFELRPDQPPGVDAMAQLVARYGEERMKMAHERLSAMGAHEGIHYDFDRARAPNSFDAHRLIKLAGDRQPEIV